MDNQSVWYNCKEYRLNLFSDDTEVWIRDIHKYDENYRDVYLDVPCEGNDAVLDALPVVDGLRFSDEQTKAGIYFGKGNIKKTWREGEQFLALIEVDGKEITIMMEETQIVMKSKEDFTARYVYKKDCEQIRSISENGNDYEHNGILSERYMWKIMDDYFVSKDGVLRISLN